MNQDNQIVRKKVLYITSTDLRNPLRGTPIRIHHLLTELTKHHDVTVCALGTDAKNVDFIPYPTGTSIQKLTTLKRLVRERKIEVVLTSTETNVKLPVVLKLCTGVSIGIDLHGLLHEEWRFKGAIGHWKSWCMKLRTAFWLFWYDRVFPVSSKLGSYYAWVNSKFVPIYGGVDLEDYPVHTEKDVTAPSTPLVIGYMGNLRGYQGTEDLIEAVARIQSEKSFPFTLLFVVSGDAGELRNLLKEKHLDVSIELHQNVPHTDVGKIISKADVLSIPRPLHPMTEYAFPSKLPEYLALGVPVIVTDVGPVAELQKKQVAPSPFIVISPSSIVDGLTQALKEVHAMGPAGRVKVGNAARAFTAEYLSWHTIGKQFASAVSELDHE